MSSLAYQFDAQLRPLFYDDGLSELKIDVSNFVGKKIQEFLAVRDKSVDDYEFRQKKKPGLSRSFIKGVIEGTDEFRSIEALEIVFYSMHLNDEEMNDLKNAFKNEEKAKNIPQKRTKIEAAKTAAVIANIPGIENLKKQTIEEIFKNCQKKTMALLINEVMLARGVSTEEFFKKLQLHYQKDSILMVLTGDRIPFPRVVRIICKILDIEKYTEEMIFARNEDHKKKEEKKRN